MENNAETIREEVKSRYGAAALEVIEKGGKGGCCGGAGGAGKEAPCGCDPISGDLYDAAQTAALPEGAVLASLGCGNPTALAELHPGDIVLDLGSGGGIDVLLSARRVAPGGKAYGLDMTPAMLALARENQRRAGVTNAEFLEGELEAIPLPDGAVDVIVSNCVLNLSGDKDRALAETFRVLKPGGRLAVSDVIVRGEVAPAIRRSMELWVGCIAGAMEENEFRQRLARAGFTEISIEPTRVYRVEDAREFLAGAGLDVEALAPEVEGKFASAFIRARRHSLPLPGAAPPPPPVGRLPLAAPGTTEPARPFRR